MRLANRGTIDVGNWADVTIFDYDTIQDRATYEKPMEFPTGIEWVLVNGVVTIDHGKHTGAKAGKGVAGPGAEAPWAIKRRNVAVGDGCWPRLSACGWLLALPSAIGYS